MDRNLSSYLTPLRLLGLIVDLNFYTRCNYFILNSLIHEAKSMGSKFPNLDRNKNLRIQMGRYIYTQQCHLCMLHHFDNSDWHIHQCLKKEKIPTLLNNEHLNIHGCGVSKLKGLLET